MARLPAEVADSAVVAAVDSGVVLAEELLPVATGHRRPAAMERRHPAAMVRLVLAEEGHRLLATERLVPVAADLVVVDSVAAERRPPLTAHLREVAAAADIPAVAEDRQRLMVPHPVVVVVVVSVEAGKKIFVIIKHEIIL